MTTATADRSRLLSEQVITLPEAGRRLPAHRGSGRVPPSTVLRWGRRGTLAADGRRICLEMVRVGSRWVTSVEARGRYVDALTAAALPDAAPTPRTPSDRRRSAEAAAKLAQDGWVRVAANMTTGGYAVYRATGDLPDPEWPELPLRELLRIAFRDRYIDAPDHPVLRQLRGDV